MENQTIQVNEEKGNDAGLEKFKRYASNALIGLLAIVILGMLVLLFQNRQNPGPPNIAGHQMYIVLSGSMSPTFKTGSIIFVKETDPTKIQVNDVITYTGDDGKGTTTHRVVGIENEEFVSFRTRGDANNMDDPQVVPARNVKGVVKLSIPLVGYFFGFARSKEGFLALLIIPGVILIITQLISLSKHIKEAKKA